MRRDRALVAVLLAVGLAALAWAWLLPGGAESRARLAPGGTRAAAAAAAVQSVPEIGMDRLARRPPPAAAGSRDLFAFSTPPPTPALPPPPPVVERNQVPDAPPPPPTPPPLNVKCIGTVDNGRGTKVAVFMTDAKEVVTGGVGETVLSRFKVMRIGLESVDVQDLGGEQLRRLPVRGN